jgi:hypothetical protein
MTPERYRQIRDLFEQALEQPPQGRTLWLEQACLGDEELLGEVQRLLAADALSGKFIEEPAVIAAIESIARREHGDFNERGRAPTERDVPLDTARIVIDRYRLLQKIGAKVGWVKSGWPSKRNLYAAA